MKPYAIINLKIDPALKDRSAKVAAKLGVSLSAVLNNELRRFATEQSVAFEVPEAPNRATAARLRKSRIQIQAGEYHRFASDTEALDFLAREIG